MIENVAESKSKKPFYLQFQFLRILLFVILTISYMIIFTYKGTPVLTGAIDGTFHMERVLSLENIFKSPINFNYFNHNGPVVNLFYPWLTVYPMYLLMHLTNSMVLGYYLYGILLTYATLEISFWVGYKITKQRNIGVMFALFYTFALVRTTNLYCRMAVGEVVAMTFLPLVFLGIYQVFYEEKPKFWMLTIGMTLTVYTHMISFYMSCTMVAFFMIASLIRRNFTKERFIALLKAIGSTILLTLAFFIPILQIYATTKIEPPMEYNLVETSTSLGEMITKSLGNVVDGTDVLGLGCLVLFIVALVRFKSLNRFQRDSLIVAGVYTYLCTNLAPWVIIEPVFKVMQFPWRFLGIVSLLVCFIGTIALAKSLNNKNRNKIFALLGLFIILMHFGTMGIVRGDSNNPGISNDNFYYDINAKVATFNGAGDYRPQATNETYDQLLARQVRVGDEWQEPAHVKYNANEITYEINNNAEAKSAIIPVWSYPGEIVYANGKEIKAKRAFNGATKVPLKQGLNKYTVRYEYTPLMKVGFLISLVSLIIFISLSIFKRKKK